MSGYTLDAEGNRVDPANTEMQEETNQSLKNMNADLNEELMRSNATLSAIDTNTSGLYHDTVDSSLVTIDLAHHKTHEGMHYVVGYVDQDVDTAAIEVLIETGANELHILFNFQASAGCRFDGYEDTTKTTGTAITARNTNRTSTHTTSATWSHTPAGAGDGTQLISVLFGATGNPSLRAPGSARGDNEWILAPNTKYLAKCTSLQDNTSISMSFSYYEVE